MNIKKQVVGGTLVLAIAGALSLSPVPAFAQSVNGRASPDVLPPCTFAVGRAPNRFIHKGSFGPVRNQNEAGNVIGHTPDEINERFAAVQEMNFASGNARLLISRLSDKELHGIARYYDESAPAGDNTLLRILSTRLDAQSLVRVADAFGTARVAASVEDYAPAAVQHKFTQAIEMQPMMLPPPGGGGGGGSGGGGSQPTASQTQEEIYLDYRSAPTGSESPGSAITEASVFDGLNLISLGQDAYWAGTQIHNLIEAYDPSFDDVVGGTIASGIEDVNLAADEFDQGSYEAGLDDLFGEPITYGDIEGDWDTLESVGYWFETGGGCY